MKKKERKACRTYKLVITVIFNDKLPTGYQHLAHHHSAALAQSMNAINKLYYGTVAFP